MLLRDGGHSIIGGEYILQLVVLRFKLLEQSLSSRSRESILSPLCLKSYVQFRSGLEERLKSAKNDAEVAKATSEDVTTDEMKMGLKNFFENIRHERSADYISSRGILKKPTEKFPEYLNEMREGVAPMDGVASMKGVSLNRHMRCNSSNSDQKFTPGIPPDARWTKIDRRLVCPQALEEANERFEERLKSVIVLRVLTKAEIQKLVDRTTEIRDERTSEEFDEGSVAASEAGFGETDVIPDRFDELTADDDSDATDEISDRFDELGNRRGEDMAKARSLLENLPSRPSGSDPDSDGSDGSRKSPAKASNVVATSDSLEVQGHAIKKIVWSATETTEAEGLQRDQEAQIVPEEETAGETQRVKGKVKDYGSGGGPSITYWQALSESRLNLVLLTHALGLDICASMNHVLAKGNFSHGKLTSNGMYIMCTIGKSSNLWIVKSQVVIVKAITDSLAETK